MPDRIAQALLALESTDWLRVLGLALQLVGLVATLRKRSKRVRPDTFQ